MKIFSHHPAVEYDDQGRIIGFGMTLKPTPHRFDFEGKTVYGWCASDVLSFPIIIGKTGIVSSNCPITKQNISIEVTPNKVVNVNPPDTVVTSVRPSTQVKDVRSEICGLGLFLSSKDVASAWLHANTDGFVHSVPEDFAIHREVSLELGWIK